MLQKYWSHKDRFVKDLAHLALEFNYSLPERCDEYRRSDLLTLGGFLEFLFTSQAIVGMRLSIVPEWLAEIHDPVDGNVSRSNEDIWLGIATSYAFACAVLNTAKNCWIDIGSEPESRYVHQNQPVLKRSTRQGEVIDISPLAVGNRAIDDLKQGSKGADLLIDRFDRALRVEHLG